MHASVINRCHKGSRQFRLVGERSIARRRHQAQAIVDECPDRLVDRPLYPVGHGPSPEKSIFVTSGEDDLVDRLSSMLAIA